MNTYFEALCIRLKAQNQLIQLLLDELRSKDYKEVEELVVETWKVRNEFEVFDVIYFGEILCFGIMARPNTETIRFQLEITRQNNLYSMSYTHGGLL